MAGHLADHDDRFLTAVQTMTISDIRQTARLHIANLPTGFFPQLGHGFVRRWHRTFVDAPVGVALVVKDSDGRVAAFLLGTTDQQAYMREVLDGDRLALAWRGAAGLLSRPSLARHFVRTRAEPYARRLGQQQRPVERRSVSSGAEPGAQPDEIGSSSADASAEPVGVVHALVPRPAFRGAGYGRLLLRRYELQLAMAGTRLGRLVTQADGGAADFYRRLGWREACRRLDRDGREIIQFERVIGFL